MAIPGQRPKTVQKRLKAMMFGAAGVGKTTAALQFPRVYLIDTERGAQNDQYVSMLEKGGGFYYGTSDANDIIKALMALLSEPHEYLTVVIDPLTVVYADLLDKGMEAKGEEFGRYKIPADRTIKHIMQLLLRLDMNVIVTSHAKPLWIRTKDAKGKDTAVQEGNTFDCFARLDYMFDLVFEVVRRGKNRIGIVRKTRCAGFPDGDEFVWSYDEIASRYGRDVLERGVVAEKLASPEQVAELRRLLEAVSIGSETSQRWLDAADAQSFEEMPEAKLLACIEFCRKRVLAGDKQ